MRKAVVRGAVVAVVAVGFLLLSDSGLPLIPGRAPTTPSSDPVDIPPGGPIVGVDALVVRMSQLDLAADDLRAQDSTPAAGLRAPVGISVGNPLANLDTELDGGEVRYEPDESSRHTDGTLASVFLALMVFEASRELDRDRRPRAAAPAAAG